MTDSNKKIVACRIEEPKAFGDTAKVFVNLADEVHAFQPEVLLFSYFNDEIDFSAREFIGLTVGAALERRHQKDVAYLRG